MSVGVQRTVRLWLACVAACLAIEVPIGVPQARAPSLAPDHDHMPVVPADEHLSFVAPFDKVNQFLGERFIDKWETGGAAMVHRNFMRLTSDAQGHNGWIINRLPLTYKSWSTLLKFRVSGRSAQLFGDGLALWLVRNAEHEPGSVFGRQDKWAGLGVFFDTFQNLDKSHHHKHPYISAIANDGTQHYEPEDEFSGSSNKPRHMIPGKLEGSGCSFDFRFSEARDDFSVTNATYAHISYSAGRLRVSVRQTSEADWYECIDMPLTMEGDHFFGLSAATGDLVDNHDVLAVLVHGFDAPVERAELQAVREAAVSRIEARMLDLPAEPRPSMVSNPSNYLAVIDEQAAELQQLKSTLAVLQHRLEYELSAVHKGILHAKELAESGASRLEMLHSEVRAERGSAVSVRTRARHWLQRGGRRGRGRGTARVEMGCGGAGSPRTRANPTAGARVRAARPSALRPTHRRAPCACACAARCAPCAAGDRGPEHRPRRPPRAPHRGRVRRGGDALGRV